MARSTRPRFLPRIPLTTTARVHKWHFWIEVVADSFASAIEVAIVIVAAAAVADAVVVGELRGIWTQKAAAPPLRAIALPKKHQNVTED